MAMCPGSSTSRMGHPSQQLGGMPGRKHGRMEQPEHGDWGRISGEPGQLRKLNRPTECKLPLLLCIGLQCFAMLCFALLGFALLCIALRRAALRRIALHCIALLFLAWLCFALFALL